MHGCLKGDVLNTIPPVECFGEVSGARGGREESRVIFGKILVNSGAEPGKIFTFK